MFIKKTKDKKKTDASPILSQEEKTNFFYLKKVRGYSSK